MSYSYEVSRVIDAPVETVWAVWTEEKHNEGLFHAVPGSAKIDLRPGGAWSIVMRVPDGTEAPMGGTYGEIVPNERLVTFMDTAPGAEPAQTTMDLVETDGGNEDHAEPDLCHQGGVRHDQGGQHDAARVVRRLRRHDQVVRTAIRVCVPAAALLRAAANASASRSGRSTSSPWPPYASTSRT